MWQWVIVVIALVLLLLLAVWFVTRLLHVPAVASWDGLLDEAVGVRGAPAAAGPAPPPAAAAQPPAPQPVPAAITTAAAPAFMAASSPAPAPPHALLTALETDDLTRIEGIGPKLSEVLRNAGIETFAALAGTAGDELRRIVDEAGPRFSLANPRTWPEQAALAAHGDWDGLAALQARLDAGRG